MKTLIKRYPPFSKRIVMAAVFISLVFSCSKNTDTQEINPAKFCATISWHNSIGTSGNFKAALQNGSYGLTSASVTDNGTTTITFNRDGAGHLINGSGFAYTYNNDKLMKIVTGNGITKGSGTFTFDTNSRLTNVDLEGFDDTGTSTMKYTYTYDSNDDPVKITAHLESTSNEGTSKADYDITADYLTDKQSLLPVSPEITPFSILYAYGFYMSKHLINKLVIKITSTDEGGAALPILNFTQQYTYTYDADGYVATMVHTGNPNNIYTFTHSDCN